MKRQELLSLSCLFVAWLHCPLSGLARSPSPPCRQEVRSDAKSLRDLINRRAGHVTRGDNLLALRGCPSTPLGPLLLRRSILPALTFHSQSPSRGKISARELGSTVKSKSRRPGPDAYVKATGVYSDTHGQSAALFGLAHLLGVELMPRIRHWRSLKLYRPDMTLRLERTVHLYGGVIDWALIESHWKEFLRVALAIQSGRVEASWVLTRLNGYSRRNKIYRAFRELGCVLRTIYLLRWIDSEELRRTATHEANKTEHFHDFAAHLNFGSHGILRTNSPVDQEKAVIANQLLANSVIAQTVVD